MIEFQQLSKQFRKIQVLNNIALNIEPGHRVALVGSNGAGKTTLIRCLLGQYNYHGSVLVDGLVPREHREAFLNAWVLYPSYRRR